MAMSNETRLTIQNNTDDCELPAVCVTHDLVKVKFFKRFRTCSICKTYKVWPWVTMIKCKSCKMVSHRRCLQKKNVHDETANDFHMRSIVSETISTEILQQNPLVQKPFVCQRQPTREFTLRNDVDERSAGEHNHINVASEVENSSSCPTKDTEKRAEVSETPLPPRLKITNCAYFQNNAWHMIATIVQEDDNGLGDEYYVFTRSCSHDEDEVARTIYLHLMAPTGLVAVMIKIWQRPFVSRIKWIADELAPSISLLQSFERRELRDHTTRSSFSILYDTFSYYSKRILLG